MICKFCNKADVIEGILEGVSFVPGIANKKWSSKGVYGIKAFACPECGQLIQLSLDVDTLKTIIKKKM